VKSDWSLSPVSASGSIDSNTANQQPVDVKATIDLPEDVLRRAKAEAALRGRKLRELVLEGILRVLEHPEPVQVEHEKAARRFADGCGIVNSGVGDLSSNPKHLKGFGRE
jgi:hypothetical protein